MKISEEKLSLANISQGAAIERFDLALGEILDNIQDPNTDPEAVREINLKVKIKPNELREMAAIVIEVVPKPAPMTPVLSAALLDKDVKGRGDAREIVKRGKGAKTTAQGHYYYRVSNDRNSGRSDEKRRCRLPGETRRP